MPKHKAAATTFNRDSDVEVLERETVYQGFFAMEKLTLRHRLFEGGWSAPVRRELFVRGPAVGVLLYDPEQDLVGLVEQFRVGALDQSASPWLLELVAGMVEDGESAEEVARRELREEAGVLEAELEPISSYLVSPGGTNESMTLFCGLTSLEYSCQIHGLDSEHEDIRLHLVEFSEAVAAMGSGRCNNAATLLCLQWLMLNRERILKNRKKK